MIKILAIDDEPLVLLTLRRIIESFGYLFFGATDAASGTAVFGTERPDVVLCDIQLPDRRGLDVLREFHAVDPGVPVVIITGLDSSDVAIESNASGAFDYVVKPFTVDGLRDVLARAVVAGRVARGPVTAAAPPGQPGDQLVGRCHAMHDVYRAIGRVAHQRVTVLLLGESGTGKELVARAIHQHSGRAARAFVPVNCAAVPEALLESELFGHEKGAFTGADRRRVGKFEQADGGTLFLDEVGETTPATQAKLLRVLQEQSFERVGGSETLRTDARVVAATNRDLAAMAESGRFRADLYYRLSGYTISLPPLRERGEDLDTLVSYFLNQLRAELGMAVEGLTPDAMAELRAHSWPGNLRELQSTLRQAMLEANGPVLTKDLFSFRNSGILRPPNESTELKAFVTERVQAGSQDLHAEWLARVEPAFLRIVMGHFHGNLTRAAEALGLNRMTLRTRLRQYGIRTSDNAK